jgi:DNA-binding NtrC family response regulator
MPVLAHTDASVLITGETGTGKDMIAEAIHKSSKRSRHPFIKVGLLENLWVKTCSEYLFPVNSSVISKSS